MLHQFVNFNVYSWHFNSYSKLSKYIFILLNGQVIYVRMICFTEFVIVFLMGTYSGLFTYVLSKVKADDEGVLSLMDCVFIKTDVGAKMTRGSTDDVTVSGSDACMHCHSHRGQ